MCIEVILSAVFPTVLGGCCKLEYHITLSVTEIIQGFSGVQMKFCFVILIPGEGLGKGDGKKYWSLEIRWGGRNKGPGKAFGVGGGLRESELGRKIVLSLLWKERQRTGPGILTAASLTRKGMRVDVATAPTPCYLQPSLRKAHQTGTGYSDSFWLQIKLMSLT